MPLPTMETTNRSSSHEDNNNSNNNNNNKDNDDDSIWTPVVISILITEMAERFTYFGFRAILVLYFASLGFDEDTSVALYCYNVSLAYTTPLVGAILADSVWGRYRTILRFGAVYAIGLVIVTIGAFWNKTKAMTNANTIVDTADNGGSVDTSATHDGGQGDEEKDSGLAMQRLLTFVGLFLVSVGTGGIKPCVSAFGADQVATTGDSLLENNQGNGIDNDVVHDNDNDDNPNDSKVRRFFASFYFCINLGAVTSFAVVPILRAHFGFGLAFLAPTICMGFALLLFVSKRHDYRYANGHHHQQQQQSHSNRTTNSPSLGMIIQLCIWLVRKRLSAARRGFPALLLRIFPILRPTRSPLPDNDNNRSARAQRSVQIQEASQALRVVPIMGLLPIFWMCYDQQGSVWTLQAKRMDLHGLQPEQLNVVNPVEIMLFIPLFDRVIYPFLQQRGWDISALRRMGWGMLLASISFFVSGLLEMWMKTRQQNHNDTVSVFWQLPQITLLSMAEILLSVTGLEWAYASSPKQMQAFLLGVFMLTAAVGDFFGGLLYSSVFRGLPRATTLHICGGLMLANLLVFQYAAKQYTESSHSMRIDRIGSMDDDENDDEHFDDEYDNTGTRTDAEKAFPSLEMPMSKYSD